MTLFKLSFLAACLAHLLCRQCDCLITYTPHGRFNFGMLKDNAELSKLFKGTPRENSLKSILLGVLAIFLVMAPFRIVGTLNLAGALMFAGLFFLI